MVGPPANHTFSERATFLAHFGNNISRINHFLTFLDTISVLLPSQFENPDWPWPKPRNSCKLGLNFNQKSLNCEHNAFISLKTPYLDHYKTRYCGKGYNKSLGNTLGSNLGGRGIIIVSKGHF